MLFTLLLLFTHPVHAADAVYVYTKGSPDWVRKHFPKDQKFLVEDAELEARELAEVGYLMPRQRAALFHRLGLDRSVASLDDVDKDMLVMDAFALKLQDLKKYYPALTETELTKLQREVKAAVKEKLK